MTRPQLVSVTISFDRRHLAYAESKSGRTLCGFTGAHDQDYIDRTYGGCYVIADMPLCKSCRRSTQLDAEAVCA